MARDILASTSVPPQPTTGLYDAGDLRIHGVWIRQKHGHKEALGEGSVTGLVRNGLVEGSDDEREPGESVNKQQQCERSKKLALSCP